MTEIPKILKIVMILDAAIFFILSILYISIFDVLLGLLSMPRFNRLYSIGLGGSLLVLAIFSLLVSYRKNLVQIKLFLELIIAWQIAMVFLSFSSIYLESFSYALYPIAVVWITNIILICLIVLDIFVYRKNR